MKILKLNQYLSKIGLILIITLDPETNEPTDIEIKTRKNFSDQLYKYYKGE